MTDAPRLSVIVSVEHSGVNVPAILERLARATGPDYEVILCRTPDDGSGDEAQPAGHSVRYLTSPSGSRIPEMWRDGIVAARGEFVALLTAHCVPARDWLETLEQLQWPSHLAGVGGYFVNAPEASALDWAIHLLRYAPFSRPAAVPSADNIAADNAIYRREEILACRDLLPSGFWEIEYHRQFAARGLRLSLSPDLVVTHRNRYTAAQFAEQRRVHGFQFGRGRARRLGAAGRLVYLAATPAIPLVLMAKVIVRARRYGWLRELRPAVVGWLAFLCVNWALGEARGVFSETRSRMTP